MDRNRSRTRSLALLVLAFTLGSGMHMGAWEHQPMNHMGAWEHQPMNAAMADTHAIFPSAMPAECGDCTEQSDCTGNLCAACAGVLGQLPLLAGARAESRVPETVPSVLSRTTSPEPHPPRS